jgi:hypothetical protein
MKAIGAALVLATITCLSGCLAKPPVAPPDPAAEAPANDACGASTYAGMIGTSITVATFPTGVRVIGPDTPVTRDYRRERVNVLIDKDGIITGTRCG